ncbi:uncharacterized protein METZ01_LOCUS8852 [marine metagenome]|uniref:Uncharacterized protein n=1 Tax=marine metagenome TaxID=408172 RepID=A0A381NQ58_9ZZZZ
MPGLDSSHPAEKAFSPTQEATLTLISASC